MLEHAGVHRGRDEQRAPRREGRHGEQVVGEPVRQLREDVGRRGGDEEEVRPSREADVQDVRVRAPEVRVRRAAREGLERQGRDEPARGRRQDRVHVRARLREEARELGGLVRGDGAADAEEDSLAAEDRDRVHQPPPFISWTRRSPSSVSQGATTSMTAVSFATVSARPPVATTFIAGPSSFRKRATIPSTRLTYPNRRPDWMECTVFFPIAEGGRTRSTRGSFAARWKRASAAMPMPGAMAPPR